jgi:HEPN domain-containing protein
MGEITGIFKNTCRMAERAVELLMNEKLRRETGLPKEPLTLMIEGMWIAGKTLYAV